MITISEVESADVAWIDASLKSVQQRALVARNSLTMQKQQDLTRVIIGTSGDAAQRKSEEIVAKLERTIMTMERLGGALTAAKSRLTDSRTRVLEYVSTLRGQGWGVADNGTVSLEPGSPLAGYASISPVNEMHVRQLAAENSMNLKTLLAQFQSADANAAAQIKAVAGG